MITADQCVMFLHKKTIYTSEDLNQRRFKMAHFNSSGSDTSNDLKRAPRRGAVLNLHWYKTAPLRGDCLKCPILIIQGFKKWLWKKVREQKIKKMFDPKYLVENLGQYDDLDTVLHN